jgi:hypothetical protein
LMDLDNHGRAITVISGEKNYVEAK